jgi:hypothetical protein
MPPEGGTFAGLMEVAAATGNRVKFYPGLKMI